MRSRGRVLLKSFAGGVALILVLQLALWFFVGRQTFPELVVDTINSKAGREPLVIDPEFIEELGCRDRERVLLFLAESHQIWSPDSVPRDYYESEVDHLGKEYRYYQRGYTLGFSCDITPWSGRVHFGLGSAPLAAKSWEQEWYFILGYWVPRSELRLKTIS